MVISRAWLRRLALNGQISVPPGVSIFRSTDFYEEEGMEPFQDKNMKHHETIFNGSWESTVGPPGGCVYKVTGVFHRLCQWYWLGFLTSKR